MPGDRSGNASSALVHAGGELRDEVGVERVNEPLAQRLGNAHSNWNSRPPTQPDTRLYTAAMMRPITKARAP